MGDKKFFDFVLKPMVEYHNQNIHDSTQFCAEASNDYDLDDDDMFDSPPYGCQNLFCKQVSMGLCFWNFPHFKFFINPH